jgi:hypothetical protein
MQLRTRDNRQSRSEPEGWQGKIAHEIPAITIFWVGNAKEVWEDKYQLGPCRCRCTPSDGCGVRCTNRAAAEECSSSNCSLDPEQCKNRRIAVLRKLCSEGRNNGVEVHDTKDGRGKGIYAGRNFDANEEVSLFGGEIITESEHGRRLNEECKDNKVGSPHAIRTLTNQH